MNDYAHPLKGVTDETRWESLDDHLYLVAGFSKLFGIKIGYPEICNFLGRNHDIGKSSEEFKARLRGSDKHVDHSTAALVESARYFNDSFVLPEKQLARTLKSILNVLIGHHGGLTNFEEVRNRFNKQIPKYKPSYFQKMPEIYDDVMKLSNLDAKFSLSMAIRMIFSCLVDADAIATEFFMDNNKSNLRNDSINNFKDWDSYEKRFKQVHKEKFAESKDTLINKCRREVFESAIEAADLPPGFFSLTAPVGLAKTLACIIFSILHAKKYQKDKVIYVMPYNAIIEQNADTLKEFLGEEHVLEHHSDYDFKIKRKDGTEEIDTAGKILSTNWDSPFVISSSVQLLDTLYSNKTSKCRKLHNICNSIIVFDEFQTIPTDKVKPILKALNTLKEEYGCTILFTTATLPYVKKSSWMDFGLSDIREIIKNPRELYKKTRRVKETILNIPLSYDELYNKLVVSHNEHKQILCILNYKDHANHMANLAKSSGIKTYYLSTDLTIIDRKNILKEIKIKLKTNEPFMCITTPIIEAGVDIDFPVVYRQATGRDSEEQAKGRCNRHGLREMGYFYRFILSEKDPSNIFGIQSSINNTLLSRHSGDTNSLELVEKYMKSLYQIKMNSKDKMDKGNIMDFCESLDFLEMSKFKIIEENTFSVICPHTEEAIKIIEEFKNSETPCKYFKRLQPYTLSLYQKKFGELSSMVRIDEYNGVLVINPEDVKKVYDSFNGINI